MKDISRRRWSDNDHNLGPFTYARDKYRNYACVLSSGDGDEYPGCQIRISVFGHTFISALPSVLRPWRKQITFLSTDMYGKSTSQSYWDSHAREYGFSYSNDSQGGRVGGGGFLQVFLGAQTHDSSTTQSWSCFTPWNNWRHVRHSYYDLRGNYYWTDPEYTKSKYNKKLSWDVKKQIEDACPSRTFCFTDFDGEFLQAKTRIEERQWEFGTGWFKWLSHFRKPIIHRSLDIEFSGETGKRKGSWKGGTIGHSIEMKPGELHMDAFIRYCDEHEMVYKGVGIWMSTVVIETDGGFTAMKGEPDVHPI